MSKSTPHVLYSTRLLDSYVEASRSKDIIFAFGERIKNNLKYTKSKWIKLDTRPVI